MTVINTVMSIKSVIDRLMKENITVDEVFQTGQKADYGYKSDYIEVFRNPDLGEVDEVIEAISFDGARIGVDTKGEVYVWVDDIPHSVIQKSVEREFVLRFDYTEGSPILFLAQGMTKNDFQKHGKEKLLKRLKEIFPKVTSIQMVSKPFDTVHLYL